jgi:O-antigen/teichoic acid export membrane protein
VTIWNAVSREPRTIVSDVSWLFFGRTAAFLLTFSIPLILTRVLTPEDYGVYKQFFLVQGTVLPVLSFGLPAALFYFLPSRVGREVDYVANTVKVLMASSAAAAIAVVVLRDHTARLLGSPQLSDSAIYLALFVFASGPSSILEPLMIIRRRVRLAAATGLGMDGLRAVLIVGAAALTGGIVPIFAAAVGWASCRMALLVLYLRRLGITGQLWRPFERTQFVEEWRYAWPFALAIIVSSAADSVHQYAVSGSYGPALFAMYVIGYTQIPLIDIAVDSTVDVALVRITEFTRERKLAEALSVIRGAVADLSFFLLPLYVWLSFNADDFIRVLYTDTFAGSVPIFRVFLVAIPLTVLGLDYVPRAFAQTTFVFRANLFRLVVGLALLAVLLPLYGMMGAAVATVLALGLTKIVIVLRVRRLFGVSMYDVMPWGRVLAIVGCATGTAAIGTLTSTVADARFARLVLSLAVSAILYVIVSARLGMLPDTLPLGARAMRWGRKG